VAAGVLQHNRAVAGGDTLVRDRKLEVLLAVAKTAMGLGFESPQSCPPEKFVVEVFSELRQELVQQRWREVNVLLRLAMLSGVPMALDATLEVLCDFAAELVPFEQCLAYFWQENEEQVRLRVARAIGEHAGENLAAGNVLNFWTAKYSRPMLVTLGCNEQADALLDAVGASSALSVPLIVGNRALGSLQLFSSSPDRFHRDDAQLLWISVLIAESLLTHQYANEGLITFAFTDFLTGLKTRGYFEQQLDNEIKRSERKGTEFALLMVDIDHFKMLNDRYGHHVGDQVLRDVAAILMKDMREIDTVARYGGEEFVLILPESNENGAVMVAQRLRRGVEQSRFFAGSPEASEHLTISIGIAVFGADAQSKRDVIAAADAALYGAKHSGRNSVVLYSDLQRSRRKEAI
jgi:diguanylate cyclase (GGDEF)-like protein